MPLCNVMFCNVPIPCIRCLFLHLSRLGHATCFGQWDIKTMCKQKAKDTLLCWWLAFFWVLLEWQPTPGFLPGSPRTEEPGGLLSTGSHRVRQDWRDLACMHALEKEMETHSRILTYRILWTEEPGGLLSMGLKRVRHDWCNLACMYALEKEMATHSSTLAWRTPGAEEPGGLPSMGSYSRTRLKRLRSSSRTLRTWHQQAQARLPRDTRRRIMVPQVKVFPTCSWWMRPSQTIQSGQDGRQLWFQATEFWFIM